VLQNIKQASELSSVDFTISALWLF